MPKSPILGGFSTSRSGRASDNAAINIFPEIIETKDGKVPGALYNTAGLDLVGNLGTGPIRGLRRLGDILYVVSGDQVWSLTPNGIATLCGQIGYQKTLVSMFANNRQLMIVDGVGGWVVPGGYPLTGGTIAAASSTSNQAGSLYAIGDTITLKAATGSQSSYPILTVDTVTDYPVTAFSLANPGTSYATATAVATSPIAAQPGIGTGLKLDIYAANGQITSAPVSISGGGSNYALDDTGTVAVDSGDAVYRVAGVSAGVVTSVILTDRGTAYATQLGVSTAAGRGATPNAGTGLTVNITAVGGPITASSVAYGGKGYAVGNVGFIAGGSADATYLVSSIGPFGTLTGFTVSQGGAVNDVPLTFTQQSTSGSGSGLVLSSPTFGAFVGLVPVTLPFANPMIGGISDGFGLLVFLGSQNIASSDELDLSTWDPLSYGVADQSPDSCISLVVIHDEAYILKEKNTEVWTDAGNAGFPFQPLTGVHMEYGCMATFSPAVAGEELLWLARNEQGQGIVVKAAAYRIEPVSTQALVAEFDSYVNLGDAIGYARQQGGHTFYVLTFPEADKSWVYDLTASQMAGYPMWHRIAAFTEGQWHRHWGNCFTPWKGAVTLVSETTTYQAQAVTITAATLQSASDPVGMPPSFATAVFSVWLDIADGGSATGIVFGNQGASATPGVSVTVQNDVTGTPQIAVAAWDVSAAPIVSATYDYNGWAAWVNILISIDTATQVLQVYANTIVANLLVETLLTAASIAWTSANPIAPEAFQAWDLIPVEMLPVTVYWADIAFGNGVFVAVSRDPGTIAASSTDGVTWNERAIPSAAWTSVTFGAGIFVAVSSSTVVATSPDGITWTQRTGVPSITAWVDVTFGNGVFVAITAWQAMTSPDGITWTLQSMPHWQWKMIAYGNGVFVAATTSPTISVATSPDGVSWTQHAFTAIEPQALTFGEGLFVMMGNPLGCRTSPDGITWTSRSLPAAENLGVLTYGGGGFLAIGPMFHVGYIAATSPDGITWTQQGTLPAHQPTGPVGVAFGNGLYTALIYYGPPSFMASTDDGLIWTTSDLPSFTGSVTLADLWWSATRSFVDLTVQSNRRNFISAAGGAENLGVDGSAPFGVTPPVFLTSSGTPSTFAANNGRGGGFAVSGGTLTTAGSNPPPVSQTVTTSKPWSSGAGVLGDSLTGNLYAFNPATFTDNGMQRRWLRRWRALPQGSPAAKRFASLVVDMQTGGGVPQGTVAQCMLRWSDDGGTTWSDERIVAVGYLGATVQTVKFNRLGSTRRFGGSDRIFELSSSDPFMLAILDAEVDGA